MMSIPPPDTDSDRDRPVRILQIGGGVFLRGFLDWMVDVANERGAFDGSVAVALSTDPSFADTLRRQGKGYTVLVRGLRDGAPVEERRIVRSISDAFSLERDWAHACAVAALPTLRAIVSNTTETGIVDREEPRPAPGEAPRSFPARLAALLHARWEALGGREEARLLVLPCELIEDNGGTLRRIVIAHAERWGLDGRFVDWLRDGIDVLSTLVDRIVPGFPKDEASALFAAWGYEDELAVAAEPFHLWAIEGTARHRALLPLDEAGLHLVWTEDLRPWRESKVRVLNGGHIATALAAFLAGHDTVREMLDDARFDVFLRRLIDRDILPFVPLPPVERRQYADAVLERFANPFVRHALLSISVGAVGKWRIRLLPSLLAQTARDGSASDALAFTLAALLRFARGTWNGTGYEGEGGGRSYPIRDEAAALDRINAAWGAHGADHAAFGRAVLSDVSLWQHDLTSVPGFEAAVVRQLGRIETDGIAGALERLG